MDTATHTQTLHFVTHTSQSLKVVVVQSLGQKNTQETLLALKYPGRQTRNLLPEPCTKLNVNQSILTIHRWTLHRTTVCTNSSRSSIDYAASMLPPAPQDCQIENIRHERCERQAPCQISLRTVRERWLGQRIIRTPAFCTGLLNVVMGSLCLAANNFASVREHLREW